ncbi:MAG: T9SS type A sorting domain-containing protein [Bacteroidota bacterium]
MKHFCYLVLITVFITCTFNVLGQHAPSISWDTHLGGTGSDYLYCVRQTPDGGYILAGSSNSVNGDVTGAHGANDAWVVKLSATGAVQWKKAFGGSSDDMAMSIEPTWDGGYIFAGSTQSPDGDVVGIHADWDYWIVKLSDTGGIQWQQTLGGSLADLGQSVKQTADSGYIVAGCSKSADGDVTAPHGGYDYWVMRLSRTGSLLWQRSFGGTGDDYAVSVQQAADGGFIVAGDTYSADGDVTAHHGNDDYWMVKLSAAGSMQWQRALGGTGSDYAQSVVVAADGGYVVAGGSNSADGDITDARGSGDYWVAKLSTTGTLLWQHSLGGPGIDAANNIATTSDGGYLLMGYCGANGGDITGFHGTNDYWAVKISASGTAEWQNCLGTLPVEVGWCGVQTSDSGFMVAGYSVSDSAQAWVVKLSKPTPEVVSATAIAGISITPNPATDIITVTGVLPASIHIYNSLGQLVHNGHDTGHIAISTLLPGLYFARLLNSEGQVLYTAKIVKQ